MKHLITLLACTLSLASSVWAEGKRVLPASAQVEGGYLSSQLLLKPCVDVAALGFGADDSVHQEAAVARKALPAGTCEDAVLVEKLFKARFLQYGSIALVDAPWTLAQRIERQNRAISRCQDRQCLTRELDTVIAQLSPVYFGASRAWPRGKGLCATEALAMPANKALAVLGAGPGQQVTAECGEEGVIASSCRGPHGRLLFLSCGMSGNQVNASQWLYRVGKAQPEPLFAVADGPLGVLESSCNGMPDLMTSARVSAGEHSDTFYRYDGKAYQQVYSYISTFVGTDANGNDLSIAQAGTRVSVDCR
ncbi:hypothetical protein [Pseudomonas sp. Au-Pse12]|uniref:hypothetical protein n=1 Tax=Pseudomonas sp. Au-Pse12 TaxID=2906459 RepID=UPI001E4CE53D|nr:hypothetical protein [Pseudomonas sp. Au-Pse12]MCE4055676.1 hypothetical protein [Pseudomonas sp. Au-Pse12]